MLPYQVLGVYKPTRWNASVIGHDLCDLTREHGFIPHVDPAHGPLLIRGRGWHSIPLHAEVRARSFKTNMAEGWHYDGDTTPGSKPDCFICTWASNNPTLIKRKGSEVIYQANPYEVIVFSNLQCVHRRPPGCPLIRWLFRQRLEVKK